MIGMIVVFAVLSVAIGVGITVWRNLSQSERWDIVKTYFFGAICAMIALAVLAVIVILF